MIRVHNEEIYQSMTVEEEFHLRIDWLLLHMTPTRAEVNVVVDQVVYERSQGVLSINLEGGWIDFNKLYPIFLLSQDYENAPN